MKAAKKKASLGAASFASILHPTDFSASSERALDHAMLLAKLASAQLHLVHVVGTPEDVHVTEEALRSAVAVAQKRLAAIAAKVPFEIASHTVRIGSASGEVVAHARELGVDAIVMGSVGLHGEPGVGSTAEKVLRASDIPVLTVKAKPEPKAKKAGRACTMCGKSSGDVICDACKDRVRSEASSRLRRALKE